MKNDYQAPIPQWGTLRQKQRNQVKSKFYYIFWGIATFSVVAGQVYVGSGYRSYARSLMRIFDTIEVEVQKDLILQNFTKKNSKVSLTVFNFLTLVF